MSDNAPLDYINPQFTGYIYSDEDESNETIFSDKSIKYEYPKTTGYIDEINYTYIE